MRNGPVALTALALLLPAAGCATTDQPSPPSRTPSPSASPSASPPPRMPDLVGRNLQDAQDALQAADIAFFSRSHDVTSAHRHQILDRDWKVCDQTPRAG